MFQITIGFEKILIVKFFLKSFLLFLKKCKYASIICTHASISILISLFILKNFVLSAHLKIISYLNVSEKFFFWKIKHIINYIIQNTNKHLHKSYINYYIFLSFHLSYLDVCAPIKHSSPPIMIPSEVELFSSLSFLSWCM